MKLEPGVYQRGRARVVIKSDPAAQRYRMYVLVDTAQGLGVVTMDDGSMMVEIQEEGVEVDDEQVMLVWDATEDINDTISDVFTAMALACGVGYDAKQAREMGRLEGENAVYKKLLDKAEPAKVPVYDPNLNDWSRYINTPDYNGLRVTSQAGVNDHTTINQAKMADPRLPDPGPMQVSNHSSQVPYDQEVTMNVTGQFDPDHMAAIIKAESEDPVRRV